MKSDEPKLGRGERMRVAVKAILWFVLTGLALLGLIAIANWAAWVPVTLGFLERPRSAQMSQILQGSSLA